MPSIPVINILTLSIKIYGNRVLLTFSYNHALISVVDSKQEIRDIYTLYFTYFYIFYSVCGIEHYKS